MAKKINTKVAVIVIGLTAAAIALGASALIYRQIQHNPERALEKGRQALAAGDYKNAESYLGRAYVFGKTDQYQAERLFELAEFHLIHNDQHEADWTKALGCWNKVVTNDPQNLEARRKLLDFYFQAADAGDSRLWKQVHENTKEIMDILKTKNTEPDSVLLKAHARALLSIAGRGETTNRQGLLEEATANLTLLSEKDPLDEEIYFLLAEAAAIEGRLGELSGMINAVENSREKSLKWLTTGIEQADDKATAAANLFLYKRQMLQSDPNQLKALRAEIETYSKQIQPNDKFWVVVSNLYEIPSSGNPEAELNRAIEAIRTASELKPDSVEYKIRMARLLYRKGMAFEDADSVHDALQIAADALSLPEAKETSGPLSGRNRSYRFALNTFLADAYLQQALDAKAETDKTALAAKAQTHIAEINSFLGSTTDNPIAEKYNGLLALAKGEKEKGVRELYKTYERTKALDKPNELSNIDPMVCSALAGIMKEQNQLGMQKEFLDKALQNNTPIVLQSPQLMLDYAEMMGQLGAWKGVTELAGSYQNRYGSTERTQKLLIEAAVGEAMTQAEEDKRENLFKTAEQLLASSQLSPAVLADLKLQFVLQRMAALQRSAAAESADNKTAVTAKQTEQLNQYRAQYNGLLKQMLDTAPDSLDPQVLAVACSDLIRNNQKAQAAAYLDQYLTSHPDAVNLKLLRAQIETENPLSISTEQQAAIQEQVYSAIEDPKTRALMLAQFYRSQARFDDAAKALTDLGSKADDDHELLRARFEVALEKQDHAAAEKLIQPIRTRNADGCDGALVSAQLEMMKKNYPLALRRLDECLALKPLDSTPYFLKSQINQQQENLEDACKNAWKAVQMSPQNALYARNLASMLFARNTALGSKVTVEQRDEAERAITNAMLLNPSEWQLQSVYAESIQLQAPDRALLIRKRLLESYPTASNAVMLGNMALRMAQSEWDAAKKSGLIELAGQSYEKAVALDPAYEAGIQALADYNQLMGKPEEAIKLLKGDENMLWKFYLRNGQFDEADKLLTELLAKKPDDPILLRGLILAAEGRGNRSQLKDYLDKLAKADQNKDTELLVLQKYLDSGFAAEAEQMLAGFKVRYPEDKTVLLIEAWTQMSRGRLEEAMVLTNRYLEADTKNAGAWRLRGRLFRLMNQPRKAIDDLQQSKSLADSPEVRIELATVYMEVKQSSAAIGELTAGMQNPQAPVQMRLMLERIYQQANQSESLEKLYSETLAKYPQSVFWYSQAGRYFLEKNQLAVAVNLLQKAWEISRQQGSGDINALFGYLDCMSKNKKQDEAFTLASGLTDTPFAPVAYAYMGQIQAQKQQPDKAAEHFFKALDLAQSNEAIQEMILAKIVESLGQEPAKQWVSKTLAADASSIPGNLMASLLAQKDGQFNKAIEPLDQCLKVTDKSSPAWFGFSVKKANLLIQCYVKTADKAYLTQSLEMYKAILEIQPENPSLLNNMAYLLADNNQDIEKAVEYARKAHQRDPGNPVYLDTYALTQCKAGDYTNAEQNLLRAIQLYEIMQTDVPWDLYKHLGMAREGLNKTEQALEAYRQALNTSTDSLGNKKQDIPESHKQQLQQAIEKLQKS